VLDQEGMVMKKIAIADEVFDAVESGR